MRKLKVIIQYMLFPISFLTITAIIVIFPMKSMVTVIEAKVTQLIANGAPDVISSSQLIEEWSMQKSIFELGEIKIPAYGERYGNIVSQHANLDVDLYYGDDDKILTLGAGQYDNEVIPGKKGIILIGGHNITYFEPLQNIKIGDEVIITTNYGSFSYCAYETKIVNIAEESMYDYSSDEEILILYTCYPFEHIKNESNERYIIYCSRNKK